MLPETIDLTTEVFLPEDIKQGWLPLDGQSVLHLFHFTRYPPQHMLYHDFPDLGHLLHKEEVTGFNPYTLLQFGPPLSQLSNRYSAAIKAASSPIHSFTLVPISGHPVRLPIWVFDYWREVGRAMVYRCDWKRALTWLREISRSEPMAGICEQVMAGLSCFPWNGGNCSVHDMASLLTDSWLSDFHIDYGLAKISKQHSDHYGAKISDRHVLLSVFDLNSIPKAYKGTSPSGNTADKGRRLLEVENKIICGDFDSVGGVLHLPGHWTSLIITFKPPKISYGDSLGSPMPANMAHSFQRWICHMLMRSGVKFQESDISIYSLETTIQHDTISCGLFALNAIGHHYLQQNSPLLQSDVFSLAHNRIEMASDLLQEGAVSLFLRLLFINHD